MAFASIVSLLLGLSISAASASAVESLSCGNLFARHVEIYGEIRIRQTQATFSREPNRSLDRSIVDSSLLRELLATQMGGQSPLTLLELKVENNTAYFYFRELPQNHAILADMVFVPEALRGRGISEQLFATALGGRQDIRKLVFFLDRTNKEIFDQNTALSLEDRLRRTPAFKSFSKFGFTTIEHISEIALDHHVKKFPQVILSRDFSSVSDLLQRRQQALKHKRRLHWVRY